MADNNYWLAKIRAQVCPEHSEAADFWNGLSPEWRGVVIHAAALEGREELKASLSNCLWRELLSLPSFTPMVNCEDGLNEIILMQPESLT